MPWTADYPPAIQLITKVLSRLVSKINEIKVSLGLFLLTYDGVQ